MQIENHLITQFSDMVHEKASQTKARLRPYVNVKPMSGDNWAYDGIGTLDAQETTSRNHKLNHSEIERDRREIARRRFTASVIVDKSEVRGMLQDPNGLLAKKIVQALERKFDVVGFDAMFADVRTGRNFTEVVTAVQDGVLTVDATSGLTYAKILEMNENFINNDIGLEDQVKFCMGITGKEHTALMNEEKLVSGDFSREYLIDKGQIVRASNIELIKYARSATKHMIPEIAGVRKSFVMAEDALQYGMSKEASIEVDKHPDYAESYTIKANMELGAVRTEGARIQIVNLTV